MGPKRCDRCARMLSSTYGTDENFEDCDCPERPTMSEAEIMLSNLGQCTRFVRIKIRKVDDMRGEKGVKE